MTDNSLISRGMAFCLIALLMTLAAGCSQSVTKKEETPEQKQKMESLGLSSKKKFNRGDD